MLGDRTQYLFERHINEGRRFSPTILNVEIDESNDETVKGRIYFLLSKIDLYDVFDIDDECPSIISETMIRSNSVMEFLQKYVPMNEKDWDQIYEESAKSVISEHAAGYLPEKDFDINYFDVKCSGFDKNKIEFEFEFSISIK